MDTGAASLYGLSGAALARPNNVSGRNVERARGYYFNPFAFARPVVSPDRPFRAPAVRPSRAPTGTDFGNVGRNVLRGRGRPTSISRS